MSSRTRGLAALAIFLATTAVFLWPALSGPHTYGATDLLATQAPYREFIPERVRAANTLQSDQTIQIALVAEFWEAARRGELQLWESDQAGGLPLFTGVHNRVLAPFHLVFLVVPLALGTTAAAALAVFLCQVGAYLLARRLGLGWGGAVFAAVAYTFSGPVVAFHLRILEAFVLPWLLWAIHGALFSPRRGAFLVGVAGATAATWFSGFPAAGFFNLYYATAFVLVLAWFATRGQKVLRWVGTALPVGLAMLAGTLVAAVQLLPTFGFLGAGAREPFPLDHSAGLAQLATAVSGRFYGAFQFRDWWSPFFGFSNPVEASSTMGTVTLALLAVVALGRRRAGAATDGNREGRSRDHDAPRVEWLLGRFLLPSGILVLLAVYLGGVALAVVHVLPFMATNSFGRARYLLALVIAVAAGYGLDLLTRTRDASPRETVSTPQPDDAQQRPGIAVRVQVGFVLAAVAMGVALGVDAALPVDRLGDALRSLVLPGVVLAVALVAMFVLRRAPRTLAAVLLLLVAVELQWGGWGFTPASDTAHFYPETPALDAIEAATGPGGEWRFLPLERTTLLAHTAAFLDVNDARAEYPVHGAYADLLRAADPGLPQDQTKVVFVPSFTGRLDPGSPILDALSVRYLTVALNERLLEIGPAVSADLEETSTPAEVSLPVPDGGIRGVRLDLRLADSDCRRGWVELSIGEAAARRLVHDVPRERPLTFPLPDLEPTGGMVRAEVRTTDCEVVVRGTAEVVPPAPDTALRLVSTTGWSVYERANARPRVEIATAARAIDDPARAVAAIAAREPGGPVVVPGNDAVPSELAPGRA
ncbi:MAG: hypothetical protein ACRDUY_02180, partial [Nitriliruptorales bacterium]